MQVFLKIVLLFIVGYILYQASILVVDSLRNLTKKSIASRFFWAAFFVGFATSIPEIFVSFVSSFRGEGQLAVGNALGSNITDLALIVPLLVIFSRKGLRVNNETFTLRNLLLILTATVLPFMLILDRVFSFVDGIFLLIMFFIYAAYVFHYKVEKHGLFSFLGKITDVLNHKDNRYDLVVLLFSLLTLLLGAVAIDQLATGLSIDLGFNLLSIGLIFVAVSTSLPELFVGIAAIRKKDNAIVMGEILGSLVTNANFVIGFAALPQPIVLLDLTEYALATFMLFLVMLLFYIFALTKRKIELWEAFILIISYVLFLSTQILI